MKQPPTPGAEPGRAAALHRWWAKATGGDCRQGARLGPDPASKGGGFRFVLVRRPDLVDLATSRNEQLAPGDAKTKIAAFLKRPIGDEGAAKVATAAAAAMKPVARVVKYTPPPEGGERLPGSALAEAWCLWEDPLGTLLDACPEQSRGKAKETLSGAVTFTE